jgi:hypothetical protein
MTLGNMRDNGEQVHKFTSEGVAAGAQRTVDNTGERVREPALAVLLDPEPVAGRVQRTGSDGAGRRVAGPSSFAAGSARRGGWCPGSVPAAGPHTGERWRTMRTRSTTAARRR